MKTGLAVTSPHAHDAVATGAGAGTVTVPSGVPALEPRPGDLATRFAGRLGGTHPVPLFLAAVLLGYALLAAASIVAALLVTEVILSIDAVQRGDERFVDWIVGRRTPFVEDASLLGSIMAGGVVIPALIAAVLVACAVLRRWRIAAFVLFSVAVESATYRATTLVVHRERPDVERLESLPVNESIPSGHTAASIALYCGIALLLTSAVTKTSARVAIWAVALAIPPFVALSRMARGMHHPTDLAVGVLIGIGALAVVLFAARAAGAAAERRASRRDDPRTVSQGNR